MSCNVCCCTRSLRCSAAIRANARKRTWSGNDRFCCRKRGRSFLSLGSRSRDYIISLVFPPSRWPIAAPRHIRAGQHLRYRHGIAHQTRASDSETARTDHTSLGRGTGYQYLSGDQLEKRTSYPVTGFARPNMGPWTKVPCGEPARSARL